MTFDLSPNTQAILLLTAPLIAGRAKPVVKPLGVGEYRSLACRLRDLNRQPSDLLTRHLRDVLIECGTQLDTPRLEQLLSRGLLLAQAVEHWRTRAIWVRSRADADYPRRLKKRLGEDAPPVLYGCGDPATLSAGGLAVVGSRDIPSTLVGYAENIGRLAAEARRGLISGGARGVDQAAMRGALNAGGRVAGVLANGLEKAVMRREHRQALMDGRMTLISQYDPAAGFQVGHAMQRNKLVYALADAALVVNADYEKGGTWAGAIEQLDKLKLVPIYVRSNGEVARGIEELRARGARPWPHPATSAAVERVLDAARSNEQRKSERQPPSSAARELSVLLDERKLEGAARRSRNDAGPETDLAPANELFAKVEQLIERMNGPVTEISVAARLQVSKKQADIWLRRFVEGKIKDLFKGSDVCKTEVEVAELLQVPTKHTRSCLRRLVAEDALEKLSRPLRYRSVKDIGDDLLSLESASD